MSHADYHLYLDWPETLVRTVTIPAGESVSDAVDVFSYRCIAIIMPSSWTAANLTFKVSSTLTGTYNDLYDDAGTELTALAAASRVISIDAGSGVMGPVRYLQIRSGTSGTPVVQTAARTLTLLLKDPGSEYLSPYLTPDSLSWSYGRDYPSQLVGKSIAGKLNCDLWNDEGRFSTFRESSPMYPWLIPGIGVRLVAEFDGTEYTMFKGVLDTLLPTSINGRPSAKLQAFGVLYAINQPDVHIPMQADVPTGTAVTEILDRIGWSQARREIDEGQTVMTRWWTGGIKGLTALRDLEDTDGGFIRESKDGKIVFEDRHHRLKSDHLVSQATYTHDPDGDIRYGPIVQGDPLKELYNVIIAEVRTFTVAAPAVLWTLAESGANSPSIPPGSTETFWAGFPNPSSPLGSVAVDEWTTPLVATTDYTANSQADGLGTNLTGSISVSATPFDNALKISIINNAAVVAYITLLQARGEALMQSNPVQKQAENARSKEYYGERRHTLVAKGIPTSMEAQDRVNFELSVRKDPIPILTLSVENISDEQMLEILTRDVSDRITIEAEGVTELGINEDFFVEAIAHQVRGPVHTMTLQCSPAEQFSDFWVLGTSRLGETTRLAYALLAASVPHLVLWAITMLSWTAQV